MGMNRSERRRLKRAVDKIDHPTEYTWTQEMFDEAVDRRVKALAEQVEKRCLKVFLYLPIKAGKSFGWDDDDCQALAFRMAEIYNEELRCPTQAEIDAFAEEVTRITGIGWE